MKKLGNGQAIIKFRELLATATDGICLVWPYGKCGQNGYGKVGKTSAHRLAWITTHGPIPPGKHVLHHCDNPPCFNPDCLFLGNSAINHADQKAKGRTLTGTKNGQSELTDDDVRQIRRLYRFGVKGLGCISLAQRFGVSHSTIRKAIKGATWKHVA